MFEFSQEPFKEALDWNKQAKASTTTLTVFLGKFPRASLLLGLSPNSSPWVPRHWNLWPLSAFCSECWLLSACWLSIWTILYMLLPASSSALPLGRGFLRDPSAFPLGSTHRAELTFLYSPVLSWPLTPSASGHGYLKSICWIHWQQCKDHLLSINGTGQRQYHLNTNWINILCPVLEEQEALSARQRRCAPWGSMGRLCQRTT